MAAGMTKPLTFLVVASLAAAVPAASTAWPLRGVPAPLRIGMVSPPGDDFSQIQRAFADALGARVEIVLAGDYPELIEAQIGRHIDYALYSASAYAAASIRCECLRPLATPLAQDGAAGLRSVLIVRRGEDASRGAARTIAVGPADSLAARLAPLALWEGAEPARAQGRLVEVGSLEEAEELFVRGEVDSFFGWVPADAAFDSAAVPGGSMARLRAMGLDGSAFEAHWLSPLLPNGPHAVRADMPEERVAALRAALLRYGGFAALSQDDYAPAIKALRALR